MPELIKLYIRHCAIGFGIAAAFVAMLLWFDVMGLQHLVLNSESAVMVVFLLWFMNGIVFAGVQFAWAVMNLAEKEDDNRGGNLPLLHEYRPVPVPTEERRDARRTLRR